MKLHLPIALLAAIVSSQFAVAASTTQASANASGVTFDNSNPGHANVTISANAGDLTGYYMYGTYGNNPVGAGIIGAAASGQDTKDDAPIEKFESATITMNGGKLGTLSGHGVQGNAVTGDTTVIMNGGSTGLIVGGTAYTNKANRDVTVLGTSPEGWDVTDFAYKANYGKETDESIQKQNINIQVNGGTVGQIRGTHSGHSQVHLYTDDGYLTQLHKSGNADAIAKYMQSNPLALSGNVNIDVNGGSIIAKNAGKDETVAIYGGGGTGFSVDGSVNIAVGGEANLVGDIIAGSSNNYTFVGSTNTVISGGSIKGNVYGGGDGSDPKSNVAGGQAPLVKNGTTVVLSGGTIDGNVYAAGLKDQVNGGTNVVIKNGGTKVTGTISGMGVDSDVNGERLLSIENSGGINVSWNQFQDFNAVEFKNSEIEFGTLSKDFEKVSAEGSWLQGSFEDGKVQLNANNSWLEIAGDLTTTKDSSITNTKKPMTVGGDATFQGTKIENADIKVTGNIAFNNGSLSAEDTPLASSVTNSNLVAGGNMSFQQTTMNGGTLSVGGKLSIDGATVVVDSINNGNSVLLRGGDTDVFVLDGDLDLSDPGAWEDFNNLLNGVGGGSSSAHAEPTSLTVNSDLKLSTGSSFKGTGDSSAKLTANSITTDGAVTFEKSDVKATQGDIALSAGSKVTDGSLTAAENVTIGASSTVSGTTVSAGKDVTIGASSIVSGSSVTATAGDLTVSGSELSNTDLYAREGQITISGSEVSTSGFYKIVGETVKIENSSFNNESSSTGLRISGNAEVTNGHFETSKGTLSFTGGSLVLDSDSTVNAKGGTVEFWGDSVTSKGAKLTTEDGAYQVRSQFIAEEGTVISTGNGVMHFHKVLEATGTSINAGAGHIYTYDDVKLVGSTVTADKGYVRFGDKYGNDVISATDTTFIANEGQEITFGDTGAVKVELNGGNKLMSAEGTNGIIRFLNSSEVVSNGTNTIDAVVKMADGTKLTAQSGTLNITTRGDSSLNNVQQTGDAQINVTANGGSLNLKGTSTIESLTANNATSNITGSLTTSKLVSTGGEIANGGSLTVKQTSQLTGTTLTNSGTASFKGAVTSADSKIVNNGGTITFSETVTATGGEYKANGGTIKFDNTTNALNAVGGTYTVDNGGIIRFGNTDRAGQGVVNAEGAAFVAEGGNMYFHSDVNANGTTFTTDGGYIRFQSDVVAKNTTFVADGGGVMYFSEPNTLTRDKNTVTLNGGNTFEAKGSYFSFEGIDFIADGDNTFKGGFSLGDSTRTVYKLDENGNYVLSPSGRKEKETITVESSFIAKSGVQTIESDKYSIRLNNIKIAEDAAEGTKINVTSSAEDMDVYVRGNSSISNLTVLDGAKGFIQGDVYIAEKLVVDSAKSDSITVEETGALTAENVEIKENSGLLNKGTANLKNVALTNGSSVSNTGETLELGAATVSGSVSIKHNTDGTTKIGGITKTDDSASVSLSQTGGTVEFNGGKGTVAEIGTLITPAGGTLVHSGEGDVSFYAFMPAKDYSIKQTGTGTMVIGQDAPASNPADIGGIVQFGGTTTISQSGGGTIVNKGSIGAWDGEVDLSVSNGSTFENMCSVTLDDVAISDATLFNAGSMTMDSLVMDNATLLFAVSSFDDASSMINYTGADLTGYRTGTVSAADMIKEFGVVMSGEDASGLLQQWGSEVEFSFTLAKGSELFEKEFAYVLEKNLAEFTITLGEAAELSFADGEIKDITVEDTENGVVVKGIAVIPEPTTATLSLLALAALAARRRRR